MVEKRRGDCIRQGRSKILWGSLGIIGIHDGKKNNVVVDYCSGDFEQPVHCSSSWKPNGGFSQFSSAFSEFRVSLFLRQSLALSSMFVIPILDG